jgi:hypothetical protein
VLTVVTTTLRVDDNSLLASTPPKVSLNLFMSLPAGKSKEYKKFTFK